jgi:SAM-dependent methyltransferase
MKYSNAARLQSLALSIAARNDTELDLTQSAGKSLCRYLPVESVHPGDQVVVIGAADASTLSIVTRGAASNGSVLVIESEDDYLERVRTQALEIEKQFGYVNWRFEKAELDDLSTNPVLFSQFLIEHPINSIKDYQVLQSALAEQRTENPLVPKESADVVILDAAVNRLPIPRVKGLLAEAFRILRRGGRLVLLLLLADETVPAELPPLLNGQNLSYIPLETEIMTLLAEAGYYGMSYKQRAELPLKVVAGVELRIFTVEAYKGKQGVCLDRGHAVIYRGPWREVLDDDGHLYVRGERVAVCEKTYEILNREPYQREFMGVPCYLEVPADQAPLFDCNTPRLRDPQITKGKKSVFESRDNCCSPSSESCC